ncbi:hypothetical protein PsYK624_081520 [Phanerochaete sordida]|uniref:Fungal-type protein kinase domain-containing protein n=1 Tax=Phanerochaete sordida TaxID=48140 RepID=A0A9P3GDX7_9APHY|nr:hypothetical protein PsYK624_081520 [Phanerochaete sordida]
MLDNFLGLMPPHVFLGTFMAFPEQQIAPASQVDFSAIPCGLDSQEMGRVLIKSVEKYRLCPNIRLSLLRTKKQKRPRARAKDGSGVRGDPWASEGAQELDDVEDVEDLVATVGGKPQPKHRRGAKKKRNLLEYCDFATHLFGIDIRHEHDVDPFLTAEELQAGSAPVVLPQVLPHSESPQHKSVTPSSPHIPLSSCQQVGLARVDIAPLSPTSLRLSPGTPGNSDPDSSSADESPQDQPSHCLPRPISPATPSVSDPDSPSARHPAAPSAAQQEHLLNEEYVSITQSADNAFLPPIERETAAATAYRTSIARHARTQFLRQHRQFLFHVVLFHRSARFLRFDRAGAIVSERFDYVAQPELLASFFQRFASVSDEARGWDLSVTLPTRAEKTLFTTAVEAWLRDMSAGTRARRLPDAARTLDGSGTYPTWKVRVSNETTGATTDLLVRRPFAGELALWGRATRAYIAYDLSAQRLVFFKDSWRGDRPYLRPEFQTLTELATHAVPHVSPVLYGGDVCGSEGSPQETLASAAVIDRPSWFVGGCVLPRHVHHRIVQDIAYPLATARSPRELVQAIHDALRAIQEAHDKLGLLHRDISYRNIMLTLEGRGVLNDWDHAGTEDEKAPGIGTWKYMSVRLLECPEKIHDIVDDLEAAFWVLLYGAIQLFASPDQQIPRELFTYRYAKPDGRVVGGLYKRLCIAGSETYGSVALRDHTLQGLVTNAINSWQVYDLARKDGSMFSSDEGRAHIMRLFNLTAKPSFWVEKFAKVLEQYGGQFTSSETSRHEDETPVLKNVGAGPMNIRTSSNSPLQAHKGGKRKREDHEAVQLRRSKRLKGVHD